MMGRISCVAIEGLLQQGDVTLGVRPLISRRNDQVLRAASLVFPLGSHVFEGALPGVHQGAEDPTSLLEGGMSTTTGPSFTFQKIKI